MHFFRKRQRVSGQRILARHCLPQGCREGLIYFVIGKTLRLTRVLRFLRSDMQSGERLSSLPGMQVDHSMADAGLPRR